MIDAGPIDRIHFLDEQRRNRRTGWVTAVLVALALMVSGIPLSVLVSPALIAVALIFTYIADVFSTVPASVWQSLHDVVYILPETWRAIRSESVDIPWRTLGMLLVVPGTAVIFLIWAFVGVLFRNVGVGAVLRELKAREPAGKNLKERQLVNLIEEMAVAAGVSPPRVLIVKSTAANAAAIGLRVDDSTFIVSDGFMKELSRDEAQAIIGHLLSSVGNGDLRIASTILSALETWGVVTLLVDAPFGARARQSLRLVGRYARNAIRGRRDAREGELAVGALLMGSESGNTDLMEYLDSIENMHTMNPLLELFIKVPLLLTMGIASIAARAMIWTFTLLVCGPWIGALWRSRRRLADAGAVQLTRNPTALATALRTLAAANVRLPGGETVDFLFPVWKRDEEKDNARTDIGSTLIRMQLNPEKRLVSIARLGAIVEDAGSSAPAPKEGILTQAWDILRFAGLIVFVVMLMAALIVLNLAAVSGIMMVLWWILKIVFVTIPAWVKLRIQD